MTNPTNPIPMPNDEPYSVSEYLVKAAGKELSTGFHILDAALASGHELVQDYKETLIADLRELTSIQQAIEHGDAAACFSKERLAQYKRVQEKPLTVAENGQRVVLPHILYIPSSSGWTLRVHYAWDATRRVHVIGHLDDYSEHP
jgi:hypothetical protein